MDLDLAIVNGAIVDGSGQPRYRSDVGIRDGRIAAIAPHLQAHQTLDATGLLIAPGFIDLHSHSDWILPLADQDEILAPFIRQGVTTIVAGNCGFSPAPVTEESIPFVEDYSEMLRECAFPYRWRSMGEFLDTLTHDGVLLNVALLVGHGTLRYAVMGGQTTEPSAAQLAALCALERQALREGAFGLSVGLAYAPGAFANNEELLALLRVVESEGAIYAVHGRAYALNTGYYQSTSTPHNLLSNREQLDLVRQCGVKVQLSHLLVGGRNTWPTYRALISDVDRARDEGLDLAFDALPYTFGNSTISSHFPPWFLENLASNLQDAVAVRRLDEELTLRLKVIGRVFGDITLLWGRSPELTPLEGLDFETIARQLGMTPLQAFMRAARLSEGKARVLHGPFSGDSRSEEPLRAFLSHPLCAFVADTILTRRGRQNPASFGTFPRVLGKYCRDLGLFSLEEAVHRMTGFSADRLGRADIGRVQDGMWADLVVFDPSTVSDRSEDEPFETPPKGIRTVLISGQVVAQDGQIVSHQRHGRVLRR